MTAFKKFHISYQGKHANCITARKYYEPEIVFTLGAVLFQFFVFFFFFENKIVKRYILRFVHHYSSFYKEIS